MKLIALDTNVLMRYLTADDPRQSPEARAFIDAGDATKLAFLITLPVVCELSWLLRSPRYAQPREVIADAWRALLLSDRMRFQARLQVERAVEDYAQGPADLSDYLILHLSALEGAAEVVTFDDAFATAQGVRRLGRGGKAKGGRRPSGGA